MPPARLFAFEFELAGFRIDSGCLRIMRLLEVTTGADLVPSWMSSLTKKLTDFFFFLSNVLDIIC